MKGNTELVKILIPISDPKDGDSYAIRLAAKNNHEESIRLLIDVSDVDKALSILEMEKYPQAAELIRKIRGKT